jgi:hypothetical protein
MLQRFLDHDRRERRLVAHETATASVIVECPTPIEDLAGMLTMPLRDGAAACIRLERFRNDPALRALDGPAENCAWLADVNDRNMHGASVPYNTGAFGCSRRYQRRRARLTGRLVGNQPQISFGVPLNPRRF